VESDTTTDLLRRAGSGDNSAWTEIVSRYGRVVWASTYGFRFDHATREDVFQLAWLRLMDSLHSIDDPERLGGWLTTTTRRECLKLVKSRARTQPVGSFDDDHDQLAPHVDAAIVRAETIRDVARGFDELGVDCRELLRLCFADPRMSYSEISQTTGMPIGSIGPRRQRCLEKLASSPSVRRIIDELKGSSSQGGEA
jgi:RNA polymerase sigma factor (sigma-70 family)